MRKRAGWQCERSVVSVLFGFLEGRRGLVQDPRPPRAKRTAGASISMWKSVGVFGGKQQVLVERTRSISSFARNKKRRANEKRGAGFRLCKRPKNGGEEERGERAQEECVWEVGGMCSWGSRLLS